jgi:ribosomal biogenesis protein LAS1
MVQYIHTPWWDRAELLTVRGQFYPSAPSPQTGNATSTTFSTLSIPGGTDGTGSEDEVARQQQQHAVSRVSMWMQRGSCPHMVESTGLLAAAILDDVREARSSRNSSTSAVRLAYSAAFSRYVSMLVWSSNVVFFWVPLRGLRVGSWFLSQVLD